MATKESFTCLVTVLLLLSLVLHARIQDIYSAIMERDILDFGLYRVTDNILLKSVSFFSFLYL